MIELLLILGIFIISYILILKDFKFFFYILLIISLFLHKELFSFYRWDLLPVRGAMLAVLCAGLTRVYLDLFKDKNQANILKSLKNPMFILVLLLWVTRAISLFYSKNFNASLLLLGFFTTVVALIYLLVTNFSGKKDILLGYIEFYIHAVFGLTLFGYFQYLLYAKTGVIIGALWNIPGNIPRIGTTFWDVNHYGALLATLLPVVGIFILTKPKKQKLKYLVIFISLFVSLVLTNSRTAWIIDVVALLVFSALVLIKKYGFKGIGILLSIVILVTIPLIREYQDKDSLFRARIKQYFHYRIDSFDSHFMLLTGAFQVFEKYPFIGGGYGSFFEHFSKTKIAPTYFGRDPAALNTRVPAHTIWGELVAETGAIGLSIFTLLFILISGTLYYAFVKARKWQEAFIPGAMLSAFIGWMVAGIFYSYNTEFFWIILTLYFLYGMAVFGERYLIKNLVGKFFKSKGLMLGVLLLISITLIFVNLGKNHLIPWDEAIYAKIAKNMVVNNQYISMTWKPSETWFEKPPMSMWMMATLMKTIGFTSLAARLPTAILGLGTLIIVYFFGRKLFNKEVGFFSGFALVTTFQFLYYSRVSMTDVSVTFFITLALYLYYLARDSMKESVNRNTVLYWILSGVSIGFGIMVKGVIGFIPYAIVGLHELLLLVSKNEKLRKELIKYYIMWFITSLLVFLPWHLYMYFKYGSTFINTYLGYHVLNRATMSIENKGKPFLWYIVVLKVSMRLWFVWLLLALPLTIYHALKKDARYKLLLVWATFIFLFFSAAKSKLVWYIMPIYPVLSIIVGASVESSINFLMNRVKYINNSISRFLIIYGVVIFVLTYLFINKGLVYTGDLTGSQAKLLQLKDEEMGINEKIYLDRIEYPLALFYTDSPFEVMDISPNTGRFPVAPYSERLIILAKRGRFEASLSYYPNEDVIGEDGDWVLWHYPSEYHLDTEKVKEIERQLEEVSVGNLTIAKQKKINTLTQEKEDLLKDIKENLLREEIMKK